VGTLDRRILWQEQSKVQLHFLYYDTSLLLSILTTGWVTACHTMERGREVHLSPCVSRNLNRLLGELEKAGELWVLSRRLEGFELISGDTKL